MMSDMETLVLLPETITGAWVSLLLLTWELSACILTLGPLGGGGALYVAILGPLACCRAAARPKMDSCSCCRCLMAETAADQVGGATPGHEVLTAPARDSCFRPLQLCKCRAGRLLGLQHWWSCWDVYCLHACKSQQLAMPR